jgi:hypothetical protein
VCPVEPFWLCIYRNIRIYQIFLASSFSIIKQLMRALVVNIIINTITTWATTIEIITLHWTNCIIRNNKCIFTKLNAVFIHPQNGCMKKQKYYNRKFPTNTRSIQQYTIFSISPVIDFTDGLGEQYYRSPKRLRYR